MSQLLDLNTESGAHIDQRLRENIIGWLITVRPDGRPHAVAVWFLWDGETIHIFSQPNQQKLRNLQQNTHVVLALDDTGQGSDPITLEGTATLLEPTKTMLATDEGQAIKAAYIAKYGERIKRIGYTTEQMLLVYSQPIRIVPTSIH